MARCECGRPKATGAESCERCASLDGRNVREARVLRALQTANGWATLASLKAATGISKRYLSPTLRDLVQLGRVSRFHPEPHEPAHFVLTSEREKRMGNAHKKQAEIPGTERPVIQDLEDAAVQYVADRDDRIEKGKEEKKSKVALKAAIEAHRAELETDKKGNLVYTYYDGERELEVKLEEKHTVDVTVRVKSHDDDSNVIDLDAEAAKVG